MSPLVHAALTVWAAHISCADPTFHSYVEPPPVPADGVMRVVGNLELHVDAAIIEKHTLEILTPVYRPHGGHFARTFLLDGEVVEAPVPIDTWEANDIVPDVPSCAVAETAAVRYGESAEGED